MKLRFALLAAIFAALVAPAFAAGPSVGGRAYIVENAATGEVLLARNADERVPIASITKLMTVLVALEHAKPKAAVTRRYYRLQPGDTLDTVAHHYRTTVHQLLLFNPGVHAETIVPGQKLRVR